MHRRNAAARRAAEEHLETLEMLDEQQAQRHFYFA